MTKLHWGTGVGFCIIITSVISVPAWKRSFSAIIWFTIGFKRTFNVVIGILESECFPNMTLQSLLHFREMCWIYAILIHVGGMFFGFAYVDKHFDCRKMTSVNCSQYLTKMYCFNRKRAVTITFTQNFIYRILLHSFHVRLMSTSDCSSQISSEPVEPVEDVIYVHCE